MGFLKRRRHNKQLLKDYKEGKILKVDGSTDNKEYFKSLENKNEP